MPARGARRNDEEHEDIAGASRKDRQGEIGGGPQGLKKVPNQKSRGLVAPASYIRWCAREDSNSRPSDP